MEKQTKTNTNTCAIYARVSSVGDRQNTDRQVADLINYAAKNGLDLVHEAFTEHISGAKRNNERPVLCECLDYCEANNVGILLISELSRLGRNVWEVLSNVERCMNSGLNIYFQKEGLSLFLADGKPNPFAAIMVSVLGTAAQLEREAIQFRLNSGREEAKRKGVKFGRKEGSIETAEQTLEKYPKVVKYLRQGKLSLREIAKQCDCALGTVQKVKRAMNENA